jgi:hypothetical protein
VGRSPLARLPKNARNLLRDETTPFSALDVTRGGSEASRHSAKRGKELGRGGGQNLIILPDCKLIRNLDDPSGIEWFSSGGYEDGKFDRGNLSCVTK